MKIPAITIPLLALPFNSSTNSIPVGIIQKPTHDLNVMIRKFKSKMCSRPEENVYHKKVIFKKNLVVKYHTFFTLLSLLKNHFCSFTVRITDIVYRISNFISQILNLIFRILNITSLILSLICQILNLICRISHFICHFLSFIFRFLSIISHI
jgi:hypothetical protein